MGGHLGFGSAIRRKYHFVANSGDAEDMSCSLLFNLLILDGENIFESNSFIV